MSIPSTYVKPFLDVDQQLDRLAERGMVFNDREHAYRQLQAIGYYRLSGYWYPFRRDADDKSDPRPSTFTPGTSFDEILEIYHFDERLRSAILHALSLIEIAIRFRIGHLLGRKHQFAHTLAASLDPDWTKLEARSSSGPNCTEGCGWEESRHHQWVEKQARNESVSSEAFVAHIFSNYGEPLPVWTATEIMSLGALNQLFGGMNQTDRQQIAVDFDLYTSDGNGDAATLSNWLEHLRQARNVCAHHARLWNRNQTAPLGASELTEFEHLKGVETGPHRVLSVSRPASRVYGSLVLIAYLLARISYTNEVRDGLRTLVEEFAGHSPQRLHAMGFPEGWEGQQIWQGPYARNKTLARRAHWLRNVDLLYTAQAAARLEVKPAGSERQGLLNFYRKKGAALSVPGTEAHRYPSFQFDAQSGDLVAVCVLANRRLLDGGLGTDEQRWGALEWWVTPNDQVPEGLSPYKALEAEVLTEDVLNSIIPPRDDERPRAHQT